MTHVMTTGTDNANEMGLPGIPVIQTMSDGSRRRLVDVRDVEWSDGNDTETGWWYTPVGTGTDIDGVAEIVESGTLTADSDRDEVLVAIGRDLRARLGGGVEHVAREI